MANLPIHFTLPDGTPGSPNFSDDGSSMKRNTAYAFYDFYLLFFILLLYTLDTHVFRQQNLLEIFGNLLEIF